MCKGKQELELLGKHEQGCSHGSHLIPAAAAPRRRFPFMQVSCSLLGEFMVTKICLNCPLQERFSPEAQEAAGLQGDGGQTVSP